ncbi:MAG: cytochrome c [Thermoanaerobaculia bacterium]
MRSSYSMRFPWFLAALLGVAALSPSSARAQEPGIHPPLGPHTTVDELLGRHARDVFRRQLEKRLQGDKSHAWGEYAAWGRELLVKGSVANPPLGPSPSARLSKSYRCVHCHNLVREDARLVSQDPEERERLLRASLPAHGAVRDGSLPSLVPATTLWGAINRTRFYNGLFEKYNGLRIADGSRMNPERISDAVQICSRFCSAGRYPEPWELDSILAALWELELTMRDLDFSPDAAARVIAGLEGGDPAALESARALVRDSYLRVAHAEAREKPKELKKNVDVYEGGNRETGDAGRGALVFQASCGGCHGADVAAPAPAALARRAREDANFYRAPLRGTERRGGLYMPPFSTQRLSARQLADVRAYLASLRGER